MVKSRDAFRTISEVAERLDTPAHVLRFWESKFSQIKPVKRAGGRRYYRPEDMDLLAGIKSLLHKDGLTIKGAQKLLREKGVRHVAALGQNLMDTDQPDDFDMTVDPTHQIEDHPFDDTDADDADTIDSAPPASGTVVPLMPPPIGTQAASTTTAPGPTAAPTSTPTSTPSGGLVAGSSEKRGPVTPQRRHLFGVIANADPSRISRRSARIRPLLARLGEIAVAARRA